jgi:hypothetical protein
VLSRLQSFDNLQASEFAATLIVPTADNPLRLSERLWRLRPSTARFVTSPRVGYASRPNLAIDGIGLSPTRFAALPAATENISPNRQVWLVAVVAATQRSGRYRMQSVCVCSVKNSGFILACSYRAGSPASQKYWIGFVRVERVYSGFSGATKPEVKVRARTHSAAGKILGWWLG